MKKIGWIGTGVMGKSMAGRLLKEGYQVTLYNRTRSKCEELIKEGALWADSPCKAAEGADFIFTIVGDPSDVREVILGDSGVLAGATQGATVVDMTTSDPSLAVEISHNCRKGGLFALDAPVSGGDIGAQNGTLAIMVGGEKEAYEKTLPLFNVMGENIAYLGGAGSGQHTKMCNQILIASTMVGVVESLIYAFKAELSQEQVIDVIGKGAAASWSINNLGRRITAENFDPGFFIKHFVKDMGIALKEAHKMQLSLPGLAQAHQFYEAAIASGLQLDGTQGLYKVYKKLNGLN